jgi:hypothetical protein
LVSVVLIFKEEEGRLKVAPGVKAAAGATRRKAEESFMVKLRIKILPTKVWPWKIPQQKPNELLRPLRCTKKIEDDDRCLD